ncbi:septal ring lytic transglycosylase RlpA family protein [Streptosporangium sp. NPDC000396]|uniref:septal ring lytic transglycosylase RlpA family protein n=1 Tax=Streptosporangium sp. NPDC000396 TaxID=3366185 RepID=UPI0036C5055A
MGLHSHTPSPDTSSWKNPSKRRLAAMAAAGFAVMTVASATVWALSTGDAPSRTTASAGLAAAQRSGDPSPGAAPSASPSPDNSGTENARAAADEVTTPSSTSETPAPGGEPGAAPTAAPDVTAKPGGGATRPGTAPKPATGTGSRTAARSGDAAATEAKAATGTKGAIKVKGAKADRARTSKVTAKSKARVISTGTCGASFYAEGQMTASGERFNPNAMTAAHKSLPMGSKVRVTNPGTGRSVTVRINDRGPYVGGRCLDLSRAAFSAIGSTGAGVMRVKYEVLGT